MRLLDLAWTERIWRFRDRFGGGRGLTRSLLAHLEEKKLQFKLSQQLVMTPQLVQAIRLLQLSRLELVDEIRKELDGNPVLADDATDPKMRDGADKSMPSPSNNEPPPEERIGITERI